ncbi:MAG: TrmB family transcriptional regulator [bacterium]|nr:TrmB family transcriptional regulator [bacterium]
MDKESCIQSLVALGFTRLESEIYTYLLVHSPATGYKIAKNLGKPVANTYKAVESLANKGALFVDEGESRVCRAVPADELLGQIKGDFEDRTKKAEDNLYKIKALPDDSRVYQLYTRKQVMERTKRIINGSKHLLLMDLFPNELGELEDAVNDAVERGVIVRVITYEDMKVEGAEVFISPYAEYMMENYPGYYMNVVSDSWDYIQAFIADNGEILQSVSGSNPYLAVITCSGLIYEFYSSEIVTALKSEVSAEEMLKIAKEKQYLLEMPEEVMKRIYAAFGASI